MPVRGIPGNARYCETCGKPTYFYQEKCLTDWTEVSQCDLKDCTDIEDDAPAIITADASSEDNYPF